MSPSVTPLRPGGPELRPAGSPGFDMRVGDAERSAIADRLAHHFSEGRLDAAEFNERLDRAMQAKTMADLTGLLADLPEAAPPVPLAQPTPASRRHQRKMVKLAMERERLRLQHERRRQRRAERRQRLRGLRWVPLLVGGLVLVIVVAHWLAHSIAALLLVALVAFIWLRRRDSGYRGR
jgi:hypothetical protein